MAAQTLTVVTVTIVNPDCLVILTKKQLYPCRFFGNKNYKLAVLPLFAFRTLQEMLRGVFLV